jgi:hypothetical protein
VIEPLPSRTAPRSAIWGVGCRNGGKPAVIEPLPSRTAPRSAIWGVGCRNGGKAVVTDARVSCAVEFISSFLYQA